MTLDSKLTVALSVGETIVLTLLIWRGIWRNLPIFSAYLCWSLVTDLAGLYLQVSNTPNYFVFYAIQTIVDAVIMFAVLVELGWSVLRPVRSSLPRGSLLGLVILVAIAGGVIWPFASLSIPPDLTKQAVAFVHIDQTFIILRVVCFLVMVGFSQLLSIGWRDRELQIATGLGIYSMVSLLVALFSSHLTSVEEIHRYHEAITYSYLCTLAYWVLSFAAKEYQRKEFSPQMQQFLVLMGGGSRTGSIALTDLPSERRGKKD